MAPEGAIDELIGLVVDGSELDWEAIEAGATAEERQLIRDLRIIAGVGTIHRSHSDDAPAPFTGGRIVPFPVRDAAAPPRAVPPPHDPSALWGHFELLERVGEGAFGEVFRAHDLTLGREVAIKLLRGRAVDAPIARVLREGQAMARVSHPNVVTVYSVEQHDDRVGLCMELVHGDTLEDLLHDRGPFPVDDAARIGVEVCQALAAVHAAGLLHRDVKTRNIVRADDGRIVLMDFGAGEVARGADAAAGASVTGTPLFLAPEVLNGLPASDASDVYAVGVVLYRLVTGAYPVTATSLEGLRQAHLERRPLTQTVGGATLPGWFVDAVNAALDGDPARRCTSARVLGERLAGGRAASSRTGRVAWWRTGTALAALGLTVAAAVGWQAQTRTTVAAASGGHRLAVLPIVNRTSQPAWFADGLTAEIARAFEQVDDVLLPSQESIVTSLRGRPADAESAQAVASATHADFVLTGAVSPQSGGYRVTLQLLRAGAGGASQPASTTSVVFGPGQAIHFDGRTLEPILKAIDRPSAAEKVALEPQLPFEALDRYWQATAISRTNDRQGLQTSQAMLRDLTRDYPTFDRGWSGLADVDIRLALRNIDGPAARTDAQDAVLHALALNPQSSEALVAEGDGAFYFDWEWQAAEAAYRRAVDANPSDVRAHTQYSRLLAASGRIDDALGEARLGLELNPLSADALATVGITLYYARRPQEAVTYMQAAVRQEPQGSQWRLALSRILVELQRHEAAVSAAEQAVAESKGLEPYVAQMATVQARAGAPDRARAILADTAYAFHADQLAYVYAALGDVDRGLEALERGLNERLATLLFARVDPRLDALRQDARFARILSAGGL
ncbi:MAG: protein kinase [Vicinamibacterales bacterium]